MFQEQYRSSRWRATMGSSTVFRRGERARHVLRHEPGVTNRIRGKYCGKAAPGLV
jgi:hypothetical protein